MNTRQVQSTDASQLVQLVNGQYADEYYMAKLI